MILYFGDCYMFCVPTFWFYLFECSCFYFCSLSMCTFNLFSNQVLLLDLSNIYNMEIDIWHVDMFTKCAWIFPFISNWVFELLFLSQCTTFNTGRFLSKTICFTIRLRPVQIMSSYTRKQLLTTYFPMKLKAMGNFSWLLTK